MSTPTKEFYTDADYIVSRILSGIILGVKFKH